MNEHDELIEALLGQVVASRIKRIGLGFTREKKVQLTSINSTHLGKQMRGRGTAGLYQNGH